METIIQQLSGVECPATTAAVSLVPLGAAGVGFGAVVVVGFVAVAGFVVAVAVVGFALETGTKRM